jgi:hypothetical protein
MSRMPASERTDSSSSGRSDGWRRTRRYAAFAAIIYAVWCIAVFSIQEKFIFPIGLIAPASKQAPRGVESIWVESEPGVKVEAWLLPPMTGTRAEKAPAVIYCHGNAELVDHCVERVQGWRERGFAVMLIEYRGYGRSGGRPGQAGIAADAIRFYDALANRPRSIRGRSWSTGVHWAGVWRASLPRHGRAPGWCWNRRSRAWRASRGRWVCPRSWSSTRSGMMRSYRSSNGRS